VWAATINKMSKAYATAKKYADNKEIKIYNATRGGHLEEFERINFDDIFCNSGKQLPSSKT
jgi:hypothetical protein